MKDLVEEMSEELKELEERMCKLGAALKTKGFAEKVGVEQYKLILQQADAMITYYNVLSIRIGLLKIRKE